MVAFEDGRGQAGKVPWLLARQPPLPASLYLYLYLPVLVPGLEPVPGLGQTC